MGPLKEKNFSYFSYSFPYFYPSISYSSTYIQNFLVIHTHTQFLPQSNTSWQPYLWNIAPTCSWSDTEFVQAHCHDSRWMQWSHFFPVLIPWMSPYRSERTTFLKRPHQPPQTLPARHSSQAWVQVHVHGQRHTRTPPTPGRPLGQQIPRLPSWPCHIL